MNMALVIKIMGAVLLVTVTGIIVLAVLSRAIPEPLILIATSSLTGLAGLLAQPHANNGPAD